MLLIKLALINKETQFKIITKVLIKQQKKNQTKLQRKTSINQINKRKLNSQKNNKPIKINPS